MDLIFRSVRIDDAQPLVDVAVRAGKIAEIAQHIDTTAEHEVQGHGKVLVAGFVEGHLHLEKAYVMQRKANRSGTLKEAIAVTAELKPTLTREDIRERSIQVLRALVQAGTTHVRAHAGFDPAQGFTGLEVVLELREQFREVIDIQVVAFPQEGILKLPGMQAMMTQAMEMGADVVGGIPYNDESPLEHIDFVFDLAKRYGKDIDLHQDFADDAEHMTIEYVARRTIAEGYQGRVCVGHLTSLAAVSPARQAQVIALLREADISVMCLPATDLHLGARGDSHNVRRTLTPVRALRDGGVTVCLATNNIRNAFTPYGTGDLLHIAQMAIPACHLGGADDQATVLSMLTTNPAKALGLKHYGLAVGNDADLVMMDCRAVADVILDLPTRLMVLKRGRVVATAEHRRSVAF
ncbi:amidohydrolase family protein [Pseudomonas putida]|uniref:Amidohydrolase family protein n=1 Tax=Pseudomonas putida TaxID=303 RepID=A0ABD7BJX9_PSEPU|nr:amidohydrolase family protein [Pseudomonas putida]MBH3450328.1 amidohydrolase family protein [Pseudomonas putida]QOC99746.1 amidohydrolase family protein [Pseudomonas putida]